MRAHEKKAFKTKSVWLQRWCIENLIPNPYAAVRSPNLQDCLPFADRISDGFKNKSKRLHKHHKLLLPRKKMKRVPRNEQPVEQSVKQALATAGVSPESIVRLISNVDDKNEVIEKTGFSNNYLMKLQRKVLRSSQALRLRSPDVLIIDNVTVHVLFDSNNTPLFINKELCELLAMKGTTFAYWKKKSNVEETDTASDFRLMDQCRSIFGGRSTYNLVSAQALAKILHYIETSRQKNASFESLQKIADFVAYYLAPCQEYVELGNPNERAAPGM